MFTDNKKLISTVLIICLVGLAGLFLGKFLINQQHLFINNRSSVQTATPLPELKFQLNHSRLSIQAGPNKEAATKLLFEMISFDQERDFFYLPQIEKYTLSLTPKKIVFTIRPIAEYSNNQYGTLYNSSLIEGKPANGFTCQENADLGIIECSLFFDQAFFDQPQLKLAQDYLINYTINTLLTLTKQNLNNDEYAKLLGDYSQALEAQNLRLIILDSKLKTGTLLNQFFDRLAGYLSPEPVEAAGVCTGYVYCRTWETTCQCNDGTACVQDTSCVDHGNATCTDCTDTCTGGTDSDNGLFCRRQLDRCLSPNSGFCESQNTAYCQTFGGCFLSGDFSPLPTPTDTPGCNGTCCSSASCEGYLNDPVGDTACGAGADCCTSCSGPTGTAGCGCCETDDWDIVGGCTERNGVPGLQCCCSANCYRDTDGSCLSNKSLCPDDFTFLHIPVCGHIFDSETGEGIPNISLNMHRENEEPDIVIVTDDNGKYFDDESGNSGWGNKDSFSITPLVDSIPAEYEGPFKATTHPFLVTPDQTEVPWSTMIYQGEPDDAPEWHGTNTPLGSSAYHDQTIASFANGGTFDGDACSTKQNESELADQECRCNFELDPINPPLVNTVQIDEPEDNSLCLGEAGQERLTIISTFSDPSLEPGIDNLIQDGNFEQGTDGWNLYAEDNDDSHNFSLTTLEKKFNSRSIAITKGAETSWGPQINHSLPVLTIGQTYTFSVWVKAPTSAQFILQRDPFLETCPGYVSLQSINHVGSNQWKSLRFTFTPLDECERHANIILSAAGSEIADTVFWDGLAIEEGDQPGIFSDIMHFQVNLEAQPSEESVYSGNYWPIRIFLNRMDHAGTPANHFKIVHGPSGNFAASTSIAYDEDAGFYYLDEDLTVVNANKEPVATLVANETLFYLEGDQIVAFWVLDLQGGFPSTDPADITNFYVNAHVRDFEENEDERPFTWASDDRQTLYLTFGASSDAHWHRFEETTITEPTLNINFVEYDDESGIGDYCSYEAGHETVDLEDAELEITNSDGGTTQTVIADGIVSEVVVDCATCATHYDVALNIPTGSGYVCGCKASPTDPYVCEYFDVPASYITGNDEINFYLESVDLTNIAWFQTVGGNIQAAEQIVSYVPYNDVDGPCLIAANCQPSLIAGLPFGSSAITYSPGFPITSDTRIDTHDADNNQDGLIHYNPDRADDSTPPIAQAADGNAPEVTLNPTQENYDYFYSKFGAEYDDNELSGTAMPDDPLTGDLEVYFYKDNLTIDKNDSWSIADGRKVVVFVGDGTTNYDLIIDGGAGDDNTIIEVAEDGFLAFIVSGNITINEAVGHDMEGEDYAAATFLPINDNTNIEGVFIADGTLTIAADGLDTTRDRKFIGAGTFVGWGGISLNRDFNDDDLGKALHNVQATETFIHRPDFLLSMPNEMKVATHEWRQVPAAIE